MTGLTGESRRYRVNLRSKIRRYKVTYCNWWDGMLGLDCNGS